MRILPPKTKKKVFKGKKEIQQFFSKHVVVGNEKPIPVLQFIKEIVDDHGVVKALNLFVTMWPLEYQEYVREWATEFALQRIYNRKLMGMKNGIHKDQ